MEEKENNFTIYESTTIGSKLKETLEEMMDAKEITEAIKNRIFSKFL